MDAQIQVIVTMEPLLKRLPPFEGQVICLDRDESAMAWTTPNPVAHPSSRPTCCTRQARPGSPRAWRCRIGAGEPDLLAVASVAACQDFAICAAQLRRFLSGDVQHVVLWRRTRADSRGAAGRFAALMRFIDDERIDRLFLPVVALQQLAVAAESLQLYPGGVREIITAGEPLRITPCVVNLFRRLPNCTLQNQYGPTECMSCRRSRYRPGRDLARVAADRPAHCQCGIVYPRSPFRAGAINVAGELFIGGAALAQGYYRQPEMTQERFVDDPFTPSRRAAVPDGRPVRWLPDGNLEFFGPARRAGQDPRFPRRVG